MRGAAQPAMVRLVVAMLVLAQCCAFGPPNPGTFTSSWSHLATEFKSKQKAALGAIITVAAICGADVRTSQALEWTDRNRLAAETWRAVDEIFIDRTFNGQDWYKLRQEVVQKDYKSDEQVYKAMQEMLAKLGDKYTRYLTPAQYDALLNSATGQLTGLGVELVPDGTAGAGVSVGTVIARVEDGSPAKEAGLQRGDRVLNVDGTDTNALSPEEVAAIMRGKEGTKASVRVSRGGSEVDVSALRRAIKLKGVSYSQLQTGGKKVGYVKVRSFASSTRQEVTSALESLHREDALKRMDALVLDLRDNGGGLLQGAVETSNLLLQSGKTVVFVVTKEGNTQADQTLPNGVLSADPALPDLTTPTYVWVNGATASAAEVFAAALQENGRATLVGEQTFGKGIIQNLQQLRQGGVAVTTARYETPLHNNINKRGIPVDKALQCPDDASIDSCIAKIF
ncbi:ClpP/crotonase-like domain-containing protein [Ochromonadaceae sp. CCMP2298]|nr:ClpP/crotonase-like domain-containing protein [Ochromonadaceae sp. CCMP2298]